jgi:hypothetical protein
MHTCAIIHIALARSNAARRSTKNHDVQEIPTPQGFLVIQICAPLARLMHTTAPPNGNCRAKTWLISALINL